MCSGAMRQYDVAHFAQLGFMSQSGCLRPATYESYRPTTYYLLLLYLFFPAGEAAKKRNKWGTTNSFIQIK